MGERSEEERALRFIRAKRLEKVEPHPHRLASLAHERLETGPTLTVPRGADFP